jgi:toxin FitB
MIYLLDTNVISETIKPVPDKSVIQWLSSVPMYNFALSVITIGEIRKGIEKLKDQSKKLKILTWLDVELLIKFQNRIIKIDEQVADKWGYICAQTPLIPAIDGLIAASALVYNLKLVTRNHKDFASVSGLEIINPWTLDL